MAATDANSALARTEGHPPHAPGHTSYRTKDGVREAWDKVAVARPQSILAIGIRLRGRGKARMHGPFVPVPDRAALDELFARSYTTPVVLFQHDPFCGGSAIAYRELARLSDEIPFIDVARSQPLSRAVAERTGIRHESPQVLVLRHGQAVWWASHSAITADAVQRVLGVMPPEPRPDPLPVPPEPLPDPRPDPIPVPPAPRPVPTPDQPVP